MSAGTTGAAAGEPGGGHRGGPAGFLVGFLPWIVYWILVGNVPFRLAVVAGLAVAVLSNVAVLVRGGRPKVLELGDTVAFAVLTVVALATNDAFLERWIQPLGNLALLLIMLVSALIRRPFTLDYAKEASDPSLWDTPGFRYVNTLLTWVWVGAMAVMTVSSAIPPLVQGDATMLDGGSTLSVVCYWVVPFGVLALAILFTTRFPDWFGAEFDAGPVPAAASPAAPLPVDGAGDRPAIGTARLVLDPPDGALDDEPAVRLTGVQPGANVVVRASTVDLVGARWAGSATFTADDAGTVDTAAAGPVAGGWTGADRGGLLWSMQPAGDGGADLYIPPLQPFAVHVEAEVAGAGTLSATMVRRTLAPGGSVEEVREGAVVGRLFLPAGDGPHPGVVLFPGSEGGLDSMSSDAAVLAAHGHAALVVATFGAPGLPDELARIPLERFGAGLDWLAAHPAVAGGGVAGLAISRGSEGLLAAASRLPGLPLRLVVAISPSSVTWEAEGDAGPLAGVPAWTVAGDPVPALAVDQRPLLADAARAALADRGRVGRHGPRPLRLTGSYGAGLERAGDDVAIAAEAIGVPLVLLTGGDDQVWPSEAMAEALLRRRGPRPGDAHHRYAGAGHLLRFGTFPTTVAETGGIALGGTPAGTAAAQRAALATVLDALADGPPLGS